MRFVRYTYPTVRNQSSFFNTAARSAFGGLESEIDRLFSSAVGEFSARQLPVDLYEDAANTYIRAELPGVDRNAITVEHSDGRLTISASRKAAAVSATATATPPEGAAAPATAATTKAPEFTRAVSVPDHVVQADKITAAYENGVLTVTLPKREESKPRKVSVSIN